MIDTITPPSIVPSEDAHGSEYVATCDKRRQFISGYVTCVFFHVTSAQRLTDFVDL